jgi:LPXTG-motif cell wall-anchored protein
MKSVRTALAVMVVAALAILVPSSPAQAYPDVTVSVSTRTIVGGNDMTITATVNGVSSCAWQLTYRGETATADSGGSITAVFDTPKVDKVTKNIATATCTVDDGTGGGGEAVAALQTVEGSAEQTLLPLSSGNEGDGGGLLPNTGGERLAWLVVGGFLVLIGGATVVASRRRDA